MRPRCVPVSSIDFGLDDGEAIPIEERAAEEVTHVRGQRIAPARTPAANFAFDVTPSRLVTGIVTEHGVFPADGLAGLREKIGA